MAARRIVRARDVVRTEGVQGAAAGVGAGEEAKAPDGYISALIKLVPTEIIGAFLAIDGYARGTSSLGREAYWAIFAVMTVLCMVWLVRQTREPGKPTPWLQVILSTGAFAVWVHAIGGPFAAETWYRPTLAGILVIVYTVAITALTAQPPPKEPA